MASNARHALPRALKPATRLRGLATARRLRRLSSTGVLAAALTVSTVPAAQMAHAATVRADSGATASQTSSTSSSTTTSRSSRQTRAQIRAERVDKVLHVTRNQKGDPYRWGAAGPNAFDCSGLVYYTFRKALGKTLPRTAQAQKKASDRVWHRRNLRRGDLVFQTNSNGYAFHVGIYAGHGYMWDAPHSGSHVKKQKMWHARWRYGRFIKG